MAAVRAFVSESVAARCSESYGAAQHVRRGIARMVPLPSLRLFDAAQLARRVCGEPTINLEELRRHTSSRAGKATTDMLFEVLGKLSAADQRRFVQFVYGQSRLPANFDNGSFNVERRSVRGNPDRVLPTAGTCDFSISLPRYSSAAVMEERLLFAIRNCVAIDTDDNASSLSGDEDEDDGDGGGSGEDDDVSDASDERSERSERSGGEDEDEQSNEYDDYGAYSSHGYDDDDDDDQSRSYSYSG